MTVSICALVQSQPTAGTHAGQAAPFVYPIQLLFSPIFLVGTGPGHISWDKGHHFEEVSDSQGHGLWRNSELTSTPSSLLPAVET